MTFCVNGTFYFHLQLISHRKVDICMSVQYLAFWNYFLLSQFSPCFIYITLIVILVYLLVNAPRNQNFEIKNIIKTIRANKILNFIFIVPHHTKQTLQSAALKIEYHQNIRNKVVVRDAFNSTYIAEFGNHVEFVNDCRTLPNSAISRTIK